MDFKLSTICTCLLVIAIASYCFAKEEEKKKLKLVLDKLDKIKDAEHFLKTDLSFDKVGEEEVKINGVVDQLEDLDDEYKIDVDVLHADAKDGEYKKVVGIANQGVCQIMANQYKKYFYETLKNHANAPDPDKCPVTKETYKVHDYPLDSSKFQKFLRPGFYKIKYFSSNMKTLDSAQHLDNKIYHAKLGNSGRKHVGIEVYIGPIKNELFCAENILLTHRRRIMAILYEKEKQDTLKELAEKGLYLYRDKFR